MSWKDVRNKITDALNDGFAGARIDIRGKVYKVEAVNGRYIVHRTSCPNESFATLKKASQFIVGNGADHEPSASQEDCRDRVPIRS